MCYVQKEKKLQEKEKFMKQALKEAKKAYEKLEVPVGAIIVKNGKIIARAHNQKKQNLIQLNMQKYLQFKKQVKN